VSTVRTKQRVRYKVGRGYGLGTVLSIKDGVARIRTEKGAELNRSVSFIKGINEKDEDEDRIGTPVVDEDDEDGEGLPDTGPDDEDE